MYKLIINGKLDSRLFLSKEELLSYLIELSMLNIYSLNWVEV